MIASINVCISKELVPFTIPRQSIGSTDREKTSGVHFVFIFSSRSLFHFELSEFKNHRHENHKLPDFLTLRAVYARVEAFKKIVKIKLGNSSTWNNNFKRFYELSVSRHPLSNLKIVAFMSLIFFSYLWFFDMTKTGAITYDKNRRS